MLPVLNNKASNMLCHHLSCAYPFSGRIGGDTLQGIPDAGFYCARQIQVVPADNDLADFWAYARPQS